MKILPDAKKSVFELLVPFPKSEYHFFVIPAQAGIQMVSYLPRRGMKFGFRRNGMRNPDFSTCKAIIAFFPPSPHKSRE
jgi:hypothetical protein